MRIRWGFRPPLSCPSAFIWFGGIATVDTLWEVSVSWRRSSKHQRSGRNNGMKICILATDTSTVNTIVPSAHNQAPGGWYISRYIHSIDWFCVVCSTYWRSKTAVTQETKSKSIVITLVAPFGDDDFQASITLQTPCRRG